MICSGELKALDVCGLCLNPEFSTTCVLYLALSKKKNYSKLLRAKNFFHGFCFRTNFSLNLLKCNIKQHHWEAVVRAINLLFLAVNLAWKLAKSLKFPYGLKIFWWHRTDLWCLQVLSLFQIHIQDISCQTPNTCVSQLLPVCFRTLFVYWRCD